MAWPDLSSWDLVVSTVDRTGALDRLLESLGGQTHRAFRVVVVDQNDDDRVGPVLERHPSLDIVRYHSPRGLSRARNLALAHVAAEFVAFPDDDCRYPPDLLERVSRRFAEQAWLDGVTGREIDEAGRSAPGWATEAGPVTPANVWHRAISFAIFLRRRVVEKVGSFDERLGLGSRTPWSSGEEIDYLIRAVRVGMNVEYDPALAVPHDVKDLTPAKRRAVGRRDGGSVGYILRKHDYPLRTKTRMLVRPAGGALISLAQRDTARAGFHVATLRGRVDGLRGFRSTRAF